MRETLSKVTQFATDAGQVVRNPEQGARSVLVQVWNMAHWVKLCLVYMAVS